MITTGAKFFFGLAVLAVVGALAFSWSLHGGLTGALTMGFYGGLGALADSMVAPAVRCAVFDASRRRRDPRTSGL